MNDTESITDEIDRVEAMAKQYVREFGEQFSGEPYGLNSLTAEEHAAWYESMVNKYPPEAFRTADGRIIVGSPWVLMLPFTENGETETKRYMRTRGRQEAASG